MAYHRQQAVDTRIARIFNTYGARMHGDDGRAIPTFLRQALEGEPLTASATAPRLAPSATSTISWRDSTCSPRARSTSRSTSATRGR